MISITPIAVPGRLKNYREKSTVSKLFGIWQRFRNSVSAQWIADFSAGPIQAHACE
jgi:hypothetical protein